MRWSGFVDFEFDSSAHLHFDRALDAAGVTEPPGGASAWVVAERHVRADLAGDAGRATVDAACVIIEALAEVAIRGEAVLETDQHGRRSVRAAAATLTELEPARDELPTIPLDSSR